jgi:hypothetical protein
MHDFIPFILHFMGSDNKVWQEIKYIRRERARREF